MARPTVVNTGEANNNSASSISATITEPTEGNTMVVIVGQDGATSTITAPGGWTQIVKIEPPTVQCTATIFQKTAGASEGTSTGTFTSDRTDATMMAYVELDNSAELDDASPPTANSDTGAPDPPSVTPVDGETLCMPMLVMDRDAIGAATMTNYTQEVSRAAGLTSDRTTVQIWSRALTGTSAEDPPAISTGDDNWAATTLLWKDGSGAPTGYPSQYYDSSIVGNNPGVM